MISLCLCSAGKVKVISHFRLVVKLPALVIHFVFLSIVDSNVFTKLWLIRVAAQPESHKILILCQLFGSFLPLDVAK